MAGSRSWEMFAGRSRSLGEYIDIHDNPRMVRAYGHAAPSRVRVVEDPHGPLLGWIPTDEPDTVTMILRDKIFDIQFPYGSAAEVTKGRGEIVRLRVEGIDTP